MQKKSFIIMIYAEPATPLPRSALPPHLTLLSYAPSPPSSRATAGVGALSVNGASNTRTTNGAPSPPSARAPAGVGALSVNGASNTRTTNDVVVF